MLCRVDVGVESMQFASLWGHLETSPSLIKSNAKILLHQVHVTSKVTSNLGSRENFEAIYIAWTFTGICLDCYSDHHMPLALCLLSVFYFITPTNVSLFLTLLY